MLHTIKFILHVPTCNAKQHDLPKKEIDEMGDNTMLTQPKGDWAGSFTEWAWHEGIDQTKIEHSRSKDENVKT